MVVLDHRMMLLVEEKREISKLVEKWWMRKEKKKMKLGGGREGLKDDGEENCGWSRLEKARSSSVNESGWPVEPMWNFRWSLGGRRRAFAFEWRKEKNGSKDETCSLASSRDGSALIFFFFFWFLIFLVRSRGEGKKRLMGPRRYQSALSRENTKNIVWTSRPKKTAKHSRKQNAQQTENKKVPRKNSSKATLLIFLVVGWGRMPVAVWIGGAGNLNGIGGLSRGCQFVWILNEKDKKKNGRTNHKTLEVRGDNKPKPPVLEKTRRQSARALPK
jgi:hypothetical protein